MKVLVIGGTGMLGRAMVETGKLMNHKVYSLFRRGSGDMHIAADLNEMKLQDTLDPKFKKVLSDSDVIIYTLGSLFKSDAYKKLKSFTSSSTSSFSQHSNYDLQYMLHYDNVRKLMHWLREKSQLKAFVYTSTSSQLLPPIMTQNSLDLKNYFETKRMGEEYLKNLYATPIDRPDFHTLILRPGILQSPSSPLSQLAGSLSCFFPIEKPTSVWKWSRATFEAVERLENEPTISYLEQKDLKSN